MKFYIQILIVVICFIGCDEQSKIMDQNEATTHNIPVEDSEKESVPAYDPAMDLSVTGGDAVEILGDTLGIKMYIGTMQPGDSVAWHFHPDHTVYVIEGGTLAVYFEGMEKQTMELPAGVGFISPPLSDAAVNTGNTTIKMLTHDIYRPRNE
jgi:quercetin dioxygenase-like cupin family protein